MSGVRIMEIIEKETGGKKQGFLPALAQKLNSGAEASRISASGWKFSTVLEYKSMKEETE